MSRDWRAWHCEYDEPGSRLARRLHAVQGFIRGAIDRAPPIWTLHPDPARGKVG